MKVAGDEFRYLLTFATRTTLNIFFVSGRKWGADQNLHYKERRRSGPQALITQPRPALYRVATVAAVSELKKF